METKTVRRRRPRDRKKQLAAVAAELFSTRGYHEVGIAEIASSAGVTGPALYRHFSDKQAILTHVVLTGIDELISSTQLALEGPGAPAREQVESALTSLATLSIERRDVSSLWRWERRNLSAAGQREVRARSALLIKTWSETLRVLRPELSAEDAELLCWAALSVFGSVAVHSIRIGKRRYAALLIQCARDVLHHTPSVAATLGATVPPPTPANAHILRPTRREVLITEAGKLFQHRGFHEVSMEDIGAAAGISGPSVYRHFTSKAALFMAAANRIAERLELGRLEVSRDAADEVAALRGLVTSYVDTMRDSADLMSVGGQISALSEAERSDLRRVQRDYIAEWVRLLCTARPELSPAEARVVVHMALTIANDLIRTGRVRDRTNLRAELVALMCVALGLDRPAAD